MIVRVTSTGICGSDLHLYEVLGAVPRRGRHPRPRADGRSSRRSAREVTELKAGDRVVVPFNISCGTCFMCGQGLQSQCETTQVHEHGKGASLFGYTKLYGQVPGGQAEYLRVPFGNTPADQGARGPAGRPLRLPLRRAADGVAGGRVRRRARRRHASSCSASARSATCPRRIAQHRGQRVIGVDLVPERLERARAAASR